MCGWSLIKAEINTGVERAEIRISLIGSCLVLGEVIVSNRPAMCKACHFCKDGCRIIGNICSLYSPQARNMLEGLGQLL